MYLMLSVYIVFVGKYQPFTLDNKCWKKATGKNGKLLKHEACSAYKAAIDMYKAHGRTICCRSTFIAGVAEARQGAKREE